MNSESSQIPKFSHVLDFPETSVLEVSTSKPRDGKNYSMLEIADAMARAKNLSRKLAVLYAELKDGC